MKLPFFLKTTSAFLLLIMLIVSSCKNDSIVEIPDPDPDPMGCDTTDVSFADVIVPILEQNCYNGCHSGGNPTSGFLLDSYDGVKAKVDEGRLYGAAAQLMGFVAMPLGKDPIPDCEISQIKAWIDEGAQDN